MVVRLTEYRRCSHDSSAPPPSHAKQIINMLINDGDAKVSPRSAAFYGYVTAVVRYVKCTMLEGVTTDRLGP